MYVLSLIYSYVAVCRFCAVCCLIIIFKLLDICFLILFYFVFLFCMLIFYFVYSVFLYCSVYCFSFCIQLSLSYFCTSLLTAATGWKPNYLFTYLLTLWCRVLPEKLTGLQLIKKFPAFHGTQRFITALTSVRHMSLSWASPIQYIYPHPTSWRPILILSTHLRLGLPSGLLPSGFPTKTLYTLLSSPIRATCPAHLILLDFITRTILGEEYISFSSSLCSLLHSPFTSSLLGPNILLNTMFSNTLSFLSSLNVSDQMH